MTSSSPKLSDSLSDSEIGRSFCDAWLFVALCAGNRVSLNFTSQEITLGKGRRVSELCSQKVECSCFAATVAHVFACIFARVLPCGSLLETKNHMGCLLRQHPWPLATRFGSEKGSCVAQPQREKVLTRGFSAKREGVWRDLSTKGADSRIFGEKGNGVARPPCHFPQLGEKGRWVAQPQQGKVPTRGFSVKKETVWRDLKICQIFFISLCTSTD